MIIFIIVLCGLALLSIYYFNKLVDARNLTEEGWSGVDVQLKRRHDLIPNLVEAVKGYAVHEKGTLEEIINLRSRSRDMAASDEKQKLESGISADLRKIFALVESYPDLKADSNFRELQAALIEVEDGLQFARRYYNGAVRNYNTLIQSFPINIIATAAGHKVKDFFEIENSTERNAPNVQFN